MQVGYMDFVGNIGKGNDSKSKGKPIILKRLLPAAEVYGMLWLPAGSCGAPAVQSRGDRPPAPTSRWVGNGFSAMTGQPCNLLLQGQSDTAFTVSFRVFEQMSE